MWESSTPKVSCTLTPYGEPFHTLFMQIPHPNPFNKQRNQSKRWKQKKMLTAVIAICAETQQSVGKFALQDRGHVRAQGFSRKANCDVDGQWRT